MGAVKHGGGRRCRELASHGRSSRVPGAHGELAGHRSLSPPPAMVGECGGKEAEDEVSAAAGVAAPGREEEDDEEIDAETTAGSPGRQKKAFGASAGAEKKAKAPAEGEDISAMSASLQKFPPAPFASYSSDAELVTSCLHPSVVSGEKMGEFIHEADIYAAGPSRHTTDLTLNFGAAAAASTGRQKPISESAGAVTTLELFPGRGASPDAAEEAATPAEAAEEPKIPANPGFTNSFEIRSSSRRAR